MPTTKTPFSVDPWPALPWDAWKDTAETLHLWTQIVGKVRLVREPWLNHSWHVALYPTARGLTTSPIPHDAGTFGIDLDFLSHEVVVAVDDGRRLALPLRPRTTADFYGSFLEALDSLGLATEIDPRPNEIPDATPFPEDREHASYDPEAVERFWRALSSSARVMRQFRTSFLGKSSPVHFFWGSFDLAVTRFSGRTAPPHPGGVPALPDDVAREAYSHEVSSAGWWPGNGGLGFPAFYSYAYPAPEGFAEAEVGPADATWSEDLGEFLLPYDAVREAADPDAVLLEFLESSYAAAAELGGWDREALECPSGRPAVPRPL